MENVKKKINHQLLKEFMRQTRVVTLHIPLSVDTRLVQQMRDYRGRGFHFKVTRMLFLKLPLFQVHINKLFQLFLS